MKSGKVAKSDRLRQKTTVHAGFGASNVTADFETGENNRHAYSELARFEVPPHILDMLPDEGPSPEQIAIWRAMTGEQRLALAARLYRSAWKLKASMVRAQHPEWSEDQIKAELRRVFTRTEG